MMLFCLTNFFSLQKSTIFCLKIRCALFYELSQYFVKFCSCYFCFDVSELHKTRRCFDVKVKKNMKVKVK